MFLFSQAQFDVKSEFSVFDEDSGSSMGLPTPMAKVGKVIPRSLYTTRNFDTRKSATINSQWLQSEGEADEADVPSPLNERLVAINETGVHAMESEDDEEEHLPAGQHLLVDVDNLDASFLNSEKRLSTAMIQLVDNSGLTLLSYHCHGLKPAGVSCAGVLLESHVSFHTWPEEGVITLDLFTCGEASLLTSVKLIEDLFVIPRQGKDSEPPRVLWAYKRRGFKDQFSLTGSRDTFAYPLGLHGLEFKKEIAAMNNDQGKEARIYDVHQRHQPLSDNPETNRLLYLDGVLKSSSLGESPSYESFVHPPMLLHEHPKKVLIIGAGAGASLREVLKHNSVEQVAIIGADRSFLDFSREHLSEWNDCSDLVDRASNCLDDTRVTTFYGNPFDWFATNNATSSDFRMAFDIALIDFFDLEEEFTSEIMDNRASFFSGLNEFLSEDGVLALHVPGDVRAVDLPIPNEHGVRAGIHSERQEAVVKDLDQLGFKEMKEYEENQSGFPESRSYIVAFKDPRTAKNWHRNEAQVKQELHKRSVLTKSGKSLFKFFDGATMVSYSKSFTSGSDLGCGQNAQSGMCGEEDTLIMKQLFEKGQSLTPSGTDMIPDESDELNDGVILDANSSLPKEAAGAECDAGEKPRLAYPNEL